MPKPIKRILTIDGGGLRGVFSAAVIEQMEAQTGRPAHQLFDCICGTSAGSFLAAGLASGIEAKTLKGVFLKMGEAIFGGGAAEQTASQQSAADPSEQVEQSPSASEKSSAMMAQVLKGTFEDKRPKDCLTELIIPARNMELGRVIFFGSLPPDTDIDPSFFSNKDVDENQELWKVVLRSAALPPHFAPSGEYLDGGISPFANPCFASLVGVQRRLGWDSENTNLSFHSVGTGFHISRYPGLDHLPENQLTDAMLSAMMQDIMFLQHQLMKRQAKDVGIDYKRYNIRFDESGFEQLGIKLPEGYTFNDLASTSNPPMDKLAEIGTQVGKLRVDESDFLRDK